MQSPCEPSPHQKIHNIKQLSSRLGPYPLGYTR